MYYFLGGTMILAGIFINFTVSKRRFNRRGPGGLQHFNSYGGSLVTRFFERLAKLIGFALMLLGFGAILLAYRFGKNGDINMKDGQIYEKKKN